MVNLQTVLHLRFTFMIIPRHCKQRVKYVTFSSSNYASSLWYAVLQEHSKLTNIPCWLCACVMWTDDFSLLTVRLVWLSFSVGDCELRTLPNVENCVMAACHRWGFWDSQNIRSVFWECRLLMDSIGHYISGYLAIWLSATLIELSLLSIRLFEFWKS